MRQRRIWPWLAFLGLLAVAVGVGAIWHAFRSRVSHDLGRIAFVGSDANIWLIAADGTTQQQVTFDADEKTVRYSWPTWSPDGRELAFVQWIDEGTTGQGAIYISNQDGTGVRHLTPTDRGYFAWSPDSRFLAVVEAGRGGQTNVCGSSWGMHMGWNLVRIDVETGERETIADLANELSGVGRGDSMDPFANLAASEPRRWGFALQGVRWSANGKWLVFETPESMFLVQYPEGQVTNLDRRAPPYCEAVDQTPWQLIFSPAGERIAYVDQMRTIAVMTPDGKSTPIVEPSSDDQEGMPYLYGWSPDGRYLLFERDGVLTRVRTDGRHPQPVYEESRGVAVGRLAFSPDAKKVVFTLVTGNPGTSERPQTHLWVGNLDGSDLHEIVEGCQPDWQPK